MLLSQSRGRISRYYVVEQKNRLWILLSLHIGRCGKITPSDTQAGCILSGKFLENGRRTVTSQSSALINQLSDENWICRTKAAISLKDLTAQRTFSKMLICNSPNKKEITMTEDRMKHGPFGWTDLMATDVML